MKIKITIIAFIATLGLNYSLAQTKGYTISGNIKNLPDGITFYLIHNKAGGGADTVSHVKSKDQRFVFKETLEEEGQLRFVKMDTSKVKLSYDMDSQGKKRQSWVRLFVDNSGADIKLVGEVKDWPEVNIQGSVLTRQHDQFVSRIKTSITEYNKLIDLVNKDSAKIAEAKKKYDSVYLKKLEQIQGSYAVPLFLFNNQKLDPNLKENIYQKLSDKLKNSYYGKRLGQQIVSIKASKNVGIGKIIPNFRVKTSEGKLESVRTLARKSKYTLLDFWASWCKPCRLDIPNLKNVYGAFKDKGFNILSISTDSSLQSWQKALKEENTPWINGIELNNESDNVFGIIGIPAYILLNEKAEIVQMDLNSKFFSQSVGKLNGSPVYFEESKKLGLRGDDLYKVIEGLLGEGKK